MKRLLIADIRPQARADVDDIATYIAERNLTAAVRFLDDFDAAVDRLLQFPALGQVWSTNHPDTLATVRRWVMQTGPASIFYRPTNTTLEVIRVLHHARHTPPLLDNL